MRNSIKKLKTTGEITVNTTNKYSLINVVNYSLYQSYDDYIPQANNNQTSSNAQTNHNQPTTNNNYNNYKNKKNYKNNRVGRKPTFDIEEINLKALLNDDFDI